MKTNNKFPDKQKLLKDLLLKSVVVRIEGSVSPKNQNQLFKKQLYESSSNEGNSNNDCLICNSKFKDGHPGTFFRPLREWERRLLSLEGDPFLQFLCPFCSGQLVEMEKLKKKMELLLQEFDNILTIIKAVMKMDCADFNDGDDVSGDGDDDNNSQLSDYEEEPFGIMKREVDISENSLEENVIVSPNPSSSEPERLNDQFEFESVEIMATSNSDNINPKATRKNLNRLSSKLQNSKPQINKNRKRGHQTAVPKTSKRKRIKSPGFDDDHNSNYSPTSASEEEEEECKTAGIRKKKVSRKSEGRVNCELCQVSVPLTCYKKHLNTWKHFVELECKEAVKKKDENQDDFLLCQHCDSDGEKNFPSIETLRSHYNKCHEKGRLVCKPCGKTKTDGWTYFGRHLKGEKHLILVNTLNLTEEEIQEKLPFECPHCLQRFTNEKSLNGHLKHHKKRQSADEESAKVPSVCEICGRSFPTFSGLAFHRNLIHNEKAENEKPATNKEAEVECLKCSKSFENRKKMLKHFRKTHLPQKKKSSSFKCDQCGKICSTRAYLGTHWRVVHDNDRSFLEKKNRKISCPIPSCGYQISQRRLYPHLEAKHFPWPLEDVNESGGILCPFECGAMATSSREEWVQHVNSCSEGKEAKEKPPTCQTCKTTFPSQFSRFSHQLLSHPEASHNCQVCSRPFTTALALKLHTTTHPEAKLYLCPKCGNSFRSTCSLQDHQRTVCNDDEEGRKALLEQRREKRKKALEKKNQESAEND